MGEKAVDIKAFYQVPFYWYCRIDSRNCFVYFLFL